MLSNSNGSSTSVDSAELILQFFKENDLNISFEALQRESKINFNVVPDSEVFVGDIKKGRWDRVVSNISNLKISSAKLANLYEHIFLELLELGEVELAKTVLRQTQPLVQMKRNQAQRYANLEALLSKSYLDGTTVFEISDREKKRSNLASELMREIIVVDRARLLTLLGQALKYQNSVGLLGLQENYLDAQYDLFRGCIPTQEVSEEMYPRVTYKTLKFPHDALPEVIKFSPDGTSIVAGLTNGFMEIYDPKTAQLRMDLPYQARNEFMSHKGMILALEFSKRGNFVISAGQYGIVKIWKLATGECVRAFEGIHAEPITSACLDNNESVLLTTSFDGTLKLHGLKNAQTTAVLQGHSNVVNCACWSRDNKSIVSASSDGFVMIWNAETGKCTLKFQPIDVGGSSFSQQNSIHSLIHVASSEECFAFGSKSQEIFVFNKDGKQLKKFAIPHSNTSSCIVNISASPRNNWIYAATDSGSIHCFNFISGDLDHSFDAHDSEIIGTHQHPHLNIFISYTVTGEVKLWKS